MSCDNETNGETVLLMGIFKNVKYAHHIIKKCTRLYAL